MPSFCELWTVSSADSRSVNRRTIVGRRPTPNSKTSCAALTATRHRKWPLFGRQSKAARPFIPSGVKEFMLVSDVMTPDPITTDPSADLADAAYIMVRNGISGLPVVGGRKSLKGLVTKTDVVRALSKHK